MANDRKYGGGPAFRQRREGSGGLRQRVAWGRFAAGLDLKQGGFNRPVLDRGTLLKVQRQISLLRQLLWRLRQAVDVSCQHVHLVVAQILFLRRHLAVAAVANGLLQLRQARTVDPGARVGQLWCTECGHAFTVGTVADGTGLRVDLGAFAQIGFVAFRQWQAGQPVTHVSGNVLHALIANHLAPGRHRCNAAVEDARLDRFRLAAPAPIVIGQVREAVGPLGVRTVADGAIVGVQAGANLQCTLVLSNFSNAHGRILGKDRTELGFRLVHFALPFLLLCPAAFIARQDTFPVAQAGIQDQVSDAEQQRADKQHEPPLGQRVVVLLNAVEGMTHGLVGSAGRFALAGCEDQPEQSDDGAQRQQGDVSTPESAHVLLLDSPSHSGCPRFKSLTAAVTANRRLSMAYRINACWSEPFQGPAGRPPWHPFRSCPLPRLSHRRYLRRCKARLECAEPASSWRYRDRRGCFPPATDRRASSTPALRCAGCTGAHGASHRSSVHRHGPGPDRYAWNPTGTGGRKRFHRQPSNGRSARFRRGTDGSSASGNRRNLP